MILFVNIVDGKGTDYFQARGVVLACTEEQLHDGTWLFDNGFMKLNKADTSLLVAEKVKLSDLLVQLGFIPSKAEFRRKCQQKGLLYNGEPLCNDLELDITTPSCFHEVRLGKRFLELVIPGLWKEINE